MEIGKEPRRAEKPGYSQRVPAVDEASRLLFCLARAPRSRLPLTELCSQVGIHKSKGYSILNTLMESALVVRDPGSKAYALGPGLLLLSRAVLDNLDVRGLAGPCLSRLVARTQSTALLGVVSGERLFVVAKEEATTGIGVTIRVGHRYPLTWGAHGLALVAFLPAEERRRVLAQDRLFFYGDASTADVDPVALDRELDEVKRRGFAVDLGRVQEGVRAVAAPLFGSEQRPVGCLIAVGTFAPDSADRFGAEVAAAAAELGALAGPTLESVYRKIG